MLQFLTCPSETYLPAEQVQMALEGGCQWIQYHSDPSQDDGAVRDDLLPVVEMCRDAGVFLVLEDRPELARELGIHGVHMAHASLSRLASLREMLGPEAVIGTGVERPAEVVAMRNLDVDYATLPAALTHAEMEAFVAEVRREGVEIPLVACGEITVDNAAAAMATGVNGVLVGEAIVQSPDPVDYTARLIAALTDR